MACRAAVLDLRPRVAETASADTLAAHSEGRRVDLEVEFAEGEFLVGSHRVAPNPYAAVHATASASRWASVHSPFRSASVWRA